MKKLIQKIAVAASVIGLLGFATSAQAENNWKTVTLLTDQTVVGGAFSNLTTAGVPDVAVEIPGLLTSDVTFLPYLAGTNAATTTAIAFPLCVSHDGNAWTLVTNATLYPTATPNGATAVRPIVRLDKTNLLGWKYFGLIGVVNGNETTNSVTVSNLTAQFTYNPSTR
jgi:hypothetical protein